MEDNITVLVDAKTEYTKQLTQIMVPFIYDGLKSIFDLSSRVCQSNMDENVLMRFQEQLSLVPKWNQDIIDEELMRIQEESKCDWLDELMTAVFLSHTKILLAIKSNKNKNKINLKIPKIDHFLHKCYIESAREIWKNPYLFSQKYSHSEIQRNIRDTEQIIESSINETIRKLLPVKNILKEYLGEDNESDNFVPEKYRENLKKIVKKEIELCKNQDSEKINIDNIIDLAEKIELDENTHLKNNLEEDFQSLENINNIPKEELVEPETLPVELETKPVELETKPVELEETLSVKEQTLPVELDVKSVELETLPVESEVKSVELETLPVELETLPVESEVKSVEVEIKPVKEETLPVEVEIKPVKEETLPVELEIKPVKVEVKPVEAETLPNQIIDKESRKEEILLDNIKFEKKGIESMEIDSLDDLKLNFDFEEEINFDNSVKKTDTVTIDDSNLVNEKEINLDNYDNKDSNVKKIVIDNDKNIKKFIKPRNVNNFKFFDD